MKSEDKRETTRRNSLLVPTLHHHFLVDRVSSLQPLRSLRKRKRTLVGEPESSINGDPEHDFGVEEVLEKEKRKEGVSRVR